MVRVSMSEVWDETAAFVRDEAALLFPLALATVGLALVLLELAAPAAPGKAVSLAAALAPLPVLLLLMVGQMAITMIALVDRGSVAEALAGAFRRLPVALLAGAVVGIGSGLILLAAWLVVVPLTGGWPLRSQVNLTMLLALLPLLWLTVRALPVMGVIADAPPAVNPMPALRRTFALSRGQVGRIAAVWLIFWMGYGLVTLSIRFALGSVLKLAGRAFGGEGAGTLLALVLASLVGAALIAVWTVFVARLYRRLARG